MTPAASAVVPALEVISEAIGAMFANGANALYRSIAATLEGWTERLLIVDEAQCLSDAALDQLRAIHDAAGVGMALIGNRDLYSRLSMGESAVTLDAVRYRIGKRLSLANASADDVGAILSAWGVTNAKMRKALTEAGTQAGGLRSVCKTLNLAALLAKRAEQALTDTHLRQAWQELTGT
jgi:DNA transposition AAA+ family ATPase